MMEELNPRQLNILQNLLDSQVQVTKKSLVELAGVSEKTIDRDIRAIMDAGREHGFTVEKDQTGYKLSAGNDVRNKISFMISQMDTAGAEMPLYYRRCCMYYDLLLHSPQSTSINQLSDKYLVSRTSIVNDLAVVEKWIEDSNLQLVRSREGTYVTGPEKEIRKKLAELTHLMKHNSRITEPEPTGSIGSEELQPLYQIYGKYMVDCVEHMIESLEKRTGYHLSDIYHINIITHILIAIERIRVKQYFEDPECDTYDGVDERVLNHIKSECLNLERLLNVDFNFSEIMFIYTHFVSSGVGEIEKGTGWNGYGVRLSEETVKFCRRLMEKTDMRMQTAVSHDPSLVEYLQLHVNSMLNRIKYNIQIVNPMKEEIMKEYYRTYCEIKETLLEMSQEGFSDAEKITDDEICYLCMYFQAECNEQKVRKKTIIVCSTGVGTSYVLKKRLETSFEQLEIVDMKKVRDLEAFDFRTIDFVISTIRINRELPVPVAYIPVILNDRAIRIIKEFMSECRERNGEKNNEK